MNASTTSSAPFAIQPVHPDDIPRLASIHSAAFKQDPFAQIMFAFDDAKQEAAVSDALKRQFTEPKTTVVKAIKSPLGQIAGWMAFKRAVYPSRPVENKTASVNADEKPGTSKILLELARRAQVHTAAVQASYFNPRGIRDHVQLNLLVVDPEWQGRGVGAALVQYCNAHADREGLPTWNRSTEVAYPLYARNALRRWTRSARFGMSGLMGTCWRRQR